MIAWLCFTAAVVSLLLLWSTVRAADRTISDLRAALDDAHQAYLSACRRADDWHAICDDILTHLKEPTE